MSRCGLSRILLVSCCLCFLTWMSVFFTRQGKIFAIIFSNKFSSSFSLSLPLKSLSYESCYARWCCWLPLTYSNFFNSLFLFLLFSFVLSNTLSSRLLVLFFFSASRFWLLILSNVFLFQLFNSSDVTGSFLYFLFLCCSHWFHPLFLSWVSIFMTITPH